MDSDRQDLLAVTDLAPVLDALVEEHRRLGSPVGDFLRPGLAAAEVKRQLGEVGLPAPPEVVDLYGWADGTDEPAWQAQAGKAPFLRFLGDAWFPPLNDAVRWCQSVRDTAESAAYDSPEGLPPESFWDPSWFPVFRIDRGEIAVACSANHAAIVHEVVWDRPEEGRTFPSLTEFILAATSELRDRFVWLADDRVLLSREVAELRRSVG